MDQIQREKIAAKPKKIKAVWKPPEAEEMPVVILSLHQKWWQKMAAGEKVLELRKTKPQCKAPFRVLVYVTGGVGIVGEFICPEVLEIKNFWQQSQRRCRKKQTFAPPARTHTRTNNARAAAHTGICGTCGLILKQYSKD